MKHRLNLVAFGIEQKRCVVSSVIVASAWTAFIFSPRSDTGRMKRVNLGDGIRAKTPVATRIGHCVNGLEYANVRVGVVVRVISFAETNGVRTLVCDASTESRHNRKVKRPYQLQIPNRNRDVVK